MIENFGLAVKSKGRESSDLLSPAGLQAILCPIQKSPIKKKLHFLMLLLACVQNVWKRTGFHREGFYRSSRGFHVIRGFTTGTRMSPFYLPIFMCVPIKGPTDIPFSYSYRSIP